MTNLASDVTQDAPQAQEATPAPKSAREVVEQWSAELAALGGRDPLLNFRDLKIGTLDLAAAEPEARKLLLDGEPVMVSRLFPHEPLRSSALRSARAIRDKTRELADERGLTVCHLAVGIATWATPFAARRPTVPVMLRSATVVAQDPAETDFTIEVTDEGIVNPVLLSALDTQLGLRFDTDDLRDPSGHLRYSTVVERLREFAPPHVVDGFTIAHRAVLGTFCAEPLFLEQDLSAFGVGLGEHEVVAALAGDASAARALAQPGRPSAPQFLVLDTDAHQTSVIARAASSGHLRVEGARGSGRTQTVAGVVAELVGRGKRVLVVGSRRASLDDLATRLRSVGLGDIVHNNDREPGEQGVQRIASLTQRLIESTPESQSQAAANDKAHTIAAELDQYRDAIHEVRGPWNLTAYDVMVALVTAPDSAHTDTRIDPNVLNNVGTADEVRARLREFADLEGLTLGEETSPWFGADVSTTTADDLLDVVADLRDTAVPELRDCATRAAVEVGLPGPNTIDEALATVDLLSSVEATVATFGDQIWDEPIADYAAATGSRAYRSKNDASLGLLARRKLRHRLAELSGHTGRQERHGIHEKLLAAMEQADTWTEQSRDGRRPRTGPHLPDAIDAADRVRTQLAIVMEANPRTRDVSGLAFTDVGTRLKELAADDVHLRSLPRVYELQEYLSSAGLDDLLADLRQCEVAHSGVEVVFDYAWHSSLLDMWRESDSTIGEFDRDRHERRVEEFVAADHAAMHAAAEQVRHTRHVKVRTVAEAHEGQQAVIAGASSSVATVRELVEAAPELTLAAVPCWITSPLTVASALPPRRLFDVVVVEDAGLLTPAEAVPAISRADRVILMSDDENTPSSFTTVVEPAPDPDDRDGKWALEPQASIVDCLKDTLPACRLTGQYRFRDDRLVGFAARTAYLGRLTTVPTATGSEGVTLESVSLSVDGKATDTAAIEVGKVVDTVLHHMRTRPHLSLGVMTLNPRHTERIDSALRRALVRTPELAEYFRDNRAEPFFIKDVAHAMGDVRDAIILSLGYGRSVDGRILYRFGALGQPGGEKLLTAATLSARERMTVVSTYGADDLSPRRLTTAGGQGLREYLSYVERPGEPGEGTVCVDADAFVEAIGQRLRMKGVTSIVVGHGGAGGCALAIKHPTRDRFVLAVEIDGKAFASRVTARQRERLRPALLRDMGWRVHRVWSAAWALQPENETERLLAAYEAAVKDVDAYDWAVAAAQADAVAGMPPEKEEPSDSDEESATDDDQPIAEREGKRPAVRAGGSISDYPVWEMAAIARWLESDGVTRTESDVVALLASELGQDGNDDRNRDVVRHAVRVARAGAPKVR